MPLSGGNAPNDNVTQWEPRAADSRLASTAGAAPDGVFTSSLPVSEYVLLGEAGFEPLAAGHRLPGTSPRPAFTLTLDQ